MTAKPKKPAKKAAKKKTTKKPKAKVGRPSAFTQAIADKICERIAGGESLIKICKSKSMPDRETVRRWLNKEEYDEFRGDYARAREDQADYHVDKIAAIADNKSIDPGQVQRDRLRIDTRKWIAGKQKSKAYGDRQHVEHSVDADTARILSEGRRRATERERPKS